MSLSNRYFDDNELLEPPIFRAAYSDRTAWMMAEASRLAYEKFEPTETFIDEATRIAMASAEQTQRKTSDQLKELRETHKSPGFALLEEALATAGCNVVDIFNNGGTQAFLAKSETRRIAILAFRGTEKNFGDIKTDINARFYRDQGNRKVHTGFLKAYQAVQPRIEAALTRLHEEDVENPYALYITGHSLGGALAIIATKELSHHCNIASCYTFGSPKVGNSEFGDEIKAPVYRIVNAADMIPRLPPSYIPQLCIWGSQLIPVPGLRGWLVSYFKSIRGYDHHGDMRYLTACEIDYNNLRLISNLNFVNRWTRAITRLIKSRLKAAAGDHRISEYCGKLRFYAKKRRRIS